MNIYVLRHGIAVDKGTAGFEEDSERPLTVEGRSRLKQSVKHFDTLEVKTDVIISSPFVRARQTAEIAARAIGYKRDIVFSDTFTPEQDPHEAWAWLGRTEAKSENVMVVGHEPHLARFISVGLCGNDSLRIELKKGGLCKLQVENLGTPDQQTTLGWLLTPRHMRKL